MPTPKNPTTERFTFSIKSIMVMTVSVAIWMLMFRLHAPFATAAIFPVSYAAIVLSIHKSHWLIGLPPLTLIQFAILELMMPIQAYAISTLWVFLPVCAGAIIERGYRKSNCIIDSRFSNKAILSISLNQSAKAGWMVGLTSCFPATLFLFFAFVSGQYQSMQFNNAVEMAGMVICCSLIGFLIGFPLTVFIVLTQPNEPVDEFGKNERG